MTNATSTTFATPFRPQWSHMDQNGHMRTTAYLAAAEDSRMQFFAREGFPMSTFAELGFGPVIQRDELTYRAELRLLDEAVLSLELAGLSPDGTRFALRNTYARADGRVAATVTSFGGWLDLAARRLAAPPTALHRVLSRLARAEDYADL